MRGNSLDKEASEAELVPSLATVPVSTQNRVVRTILMPALFRRHRYRLVHKFDEAICNAGLSQY